MRVKMKLIEDTLRKADDGTLELINSSQEFTHKLEEAAFLRAKNKKLLEQLRQVTEAMKRYAHKNGVSLPPGKPVQKKKSAKTLFEDPYEIHTTRVPKEERKEDRDEENLIKRRHYYYIAPEIHLPNSIDRHLINQKLERGMDPVQPVEKSFESSKSSTSSTLSLDALTAKVEETSSENARALKNLEEQVQQLRQLLEPQRESRAGPMSPGEVLPKDIQESASGNAALLALETKLDALSADLASLKRESREELLLKTQELNERQAALEREEKRTAALALEKNALEQQVHEKEALSNESERKMREKVTADIATLTNLLLQQHKRTEKYQLQLKEQQQQQVQRGSGLNGGAC
jgi:hypothetical protein